MDDSPWFWFGLAYWSMVWAALGVAAGKPKGRGFAGGLLGLLLGMLRRLLNKSGKLKNFENFLLDGSQENEKRN